jgi:hypothetical protein
VQNVGKRKTASRDGSLIIRRIKLAAYVQVQEIKEAQQYYSTKKYQCVLANISSFFGCPQKEGKHETGD